MSEAQGGGGRVVQHWLRCRRLQLLYHISFVTRGKKQQCEQVRSGKHRGCGVEAEEGEAQEHEPRPD